MADIELVIKIPDFFYTQTKSYVEKNKVEGNIFSAVAQGTPLPKGHGRLIDADALEKKMCDREEELGDDRAMWESSAVSVALDMFGETIIEADRRGKNES